MHSQFSFFRIYETDNDHDRTRLHHKNNKKKNQKRNEKWHLIKCNLIISLKFLSPPLSLSSLALSSSQSNWMSVLKMSTRPGRTTNSNFMTFNLQRAHTRERCVFHIARVSMKCPNEVKCDSRGATRTGRFVVSLWQHNRRRRRLRSMSPKQQQEIWTDKASNEVHMRIEKNQTKTKNKAANGRRASRNSNKN